MGRAGIAGVCRGANAGPHDCMARLYQLCTLLAPDVTLSDPVQRAAALLEPSPVQSPVTEPHPHHLNTRLTQDGGHLLELLQG